MNLETMSLKELGELNSRIVPSQTWSGRGRPPKWYKKP